MLQSVLEAILVVGLLTGEGDFYYCHSCLLRSSGFRSLAQQAYVAIYRHSSQFYCVQRSTMEPLNNEHIGTSDIVQYSEVDLTFTGL